VSASRAQWHQRYGEFTDPAITCGVGVGFGGRHRTPRAAHRFTRLGTPSASTMSPLSRVGQRSSRTCCRSMSAHLGHFPPPVSSASRKAAALVEGILSYGDLDIDREPGDQASDIDTERRRVRLMGNVFQPGGTSGTTAPSHQVLHRTFEAERGRLSPRCRPRQLLTGPRAVRQRCGLRPFEASNRTAHRARRPGRHGIAMAVLSVADTPCRVFLM
jgi:hypothetical protein